MKEKCLIQGKVVYLTNEEQDALKKKYEEEYGMRFFPTSELDKVRVSKTFTPIAPNDEPVVYWNPYPQTKPTRKADYICAKKDGSVKIHMFNPKSDMFGHADEFVTAWAELPTRPR